MPSVTTWVWLPISVFVIGWWIALVYLLHCETWGFRRWYGDLDEAVRLVTEGLHVSWRRSKQQLMEDTQDLASSNDSKVSSRKPAGVTSSSPKSLIQGSSEVNGLFSEGRHAAKSED